MNFLDKHDVFRVVDIIRPKLAGPNRFSTASMAKQMRIAISIVLTLAVALRAMAQVDDDQPPTWHIVAHPSPEPDAALKYVLLPSITDRRPGNAAVIYNKLAIEFPAYGDKQGDRLRSMRRWLNLPAERLPDDEIRAFLRPHQNIITDLRLAACRESCNWEMPIRDREFYSIRLPDAQSMNGLAQLVALQARLHIKAGRFDDALPLLQTGFAMARHIVQQPLVISAIVGMAIGEIMESSVVHWVSQRGAPNLYWALTSLPEPFIDLRPAAEAEGHWLFFSFPELLELDDDTRTAEYWENVLDRLLTYVSKNFESEDNEFETRLPFALLAVKQFPLAKQSLVDRGRSAEEVERFPAARVLLMYAVHRHRIEADHAFKRLYLPFDLLGGGAAPFDTFQAPPAAEREDFLPLRLLLPAVEAFHFNAARHQRRIAMLRIVEALRRYAATHGDRLPEQLNDQVGVPVPLDPVTGKMFGFRLDGEMAVVEASPPPGITPREGGGRVEIHFVH
jgi:hypothetical protein